MLRVLSTVVERVPSVVNVKRWLVGISALVVSAMLAVPWAQGVPSPEERREDITEELERLREQVDEAAAEEAGALAELEITRRTRAGLDDTVAMLDSRIHAAEAELDAAEAASAAAEGHHAAVERRLRATRASLVQSQKVLQDQAVSRFMRNGVQTATLDVLLQVRNVRQLHDVAAFVEAVARAQVEVVERHRALEEGTARLEAETERASIEAAERRDEVAAGTQHLVAVRDEQALARSRVEVEEGREEQLLAEVRQTRADYERRIADLRAESEDISALLRQRQAGQATTVRGDGQLAYPLANAVVTSRYGFRTHPIFGTRRLHAGADFRGSTGTPVLAAASGTVVFAGRRGGYGDTVVIDHGGSLATLYAHQSRMAVATGDEVQRGETIGAVGSTGFSTGPHLHFEVRVGGTPVDPLNYL